MDNWSEPNSVFRKDEIWRLWSKNILASNVKLQQRKLCMKHVHSECKHVPSLFPPLFPSCSPSAFIFHPCQPSFSFPDATKVKQEQCSMSLHLSCRNKTPTQLCNAKKACVKQGHRDAEAWGGGMRNEEHASASCILPTQHNTTHAHTDHLAIPQQQRDHHTITTQMDTDNLSKRTVQMPQNQGNECSKKGKEKIERYREKSTLLCLQVCETLKRESKHGGREQRERMNTETRQYYSCIVIMHALHDGKPWQSL